MNKLFLIKTALILLFALPVLTIKTVSAFDENSGNPPSTCEEFNQVYQDALKGFTNYRGDKHVRQGLMGDITYWDYSKAPWEPLSSMLYASSFGESINLELAYLKSASLADAKSNYEIISKNLKKCLPSDYFLSTDHSKGYEEYLLYMDKRDEDSFFDYQYPQISLGIKKSGNNYLVVMVIYAGSDYAD